MAAGDRATWMRSTPLWVCADLAAGPADWIAQRARAVIESLAACVWIRPASDTPVRALLAVTRSLVAIARRRGGAVLVGERLDVAIASGAHGVHLGSRAIHPTDARTLVGDRCDPSFAISCAVHDREEILGKIEASDAMVLSPLFAVPGKGEPLGTEGFSTLVALAPRRTIVALGGITTVEHAVEAARAGAHAIAVRRAFLAADDPVSECRVLRDAFEHAGK